MLTDVDREVQQRDHSYQLQDTTLRSSLLQNLRGGNGCWDPNHGYPLRMDVRNGLRNPVPRWERITRTILE
jgi:hypothetical protein